MVLSTQAVAAHVLLLLMAEEAAQRTDDPVMSQLGHALGSRPGLKKMLPIARHLLKERLAAAAAAAAGGCGALPCAPRHL